jgi:hypothetical protein
LEVLERRDTPSTKNEDGKLLQASVIMKPHLVLGIVLVAGAIILSCVAGIYAATNFEAALAAAATAAIALMVGVKWVAGN